MSDDSLLVGLISAGSVLAGVVISSAVQLFVATQTHRQQLERDQFAHSRAVQDEKRTRLFQVYAIILNAAETLQDVISERKYVVATETEQARDARLGGTLNAAIAEMNKATVNLELEGTGSQVLELFGEIRRAFIRYMSGLAANAQLAAVGRTVIDVAEYEDVLQTKIGELRQLMQARLKELEAPIVSPPRDAR